jgi:hypothetical protein
MFAHAFEWWRWCKSITRCCIDGSAAARYLRLMRAEMQALADEIQQSLALLRRHL